LRFLVRYWWGGVGQFFAGAEFESLSDWRLVKYVYAAIGITLATALSNNLGNLIKTMILFALTCHEYYIS